MTYADWVFVRADIRARLGLAQLLLLNDFAALALSPVSYTHLDVYKRQD